jgi:aryl-alcohol dehydrogenase-like predicted oxidoreductase
VEAETHEVKEHTLPVLQRQWPESRLQLGPYLRLYQVHSATLDSGLLRDIPLLGELARLKKEGVVIGLSLSGPQQGHALRQATEVQIDGVRLFDCVQATWNLIEPSAGDALKTVRAQGMGVIVKEALANGRLTQRNSEPSFAAKLALLEQEAARLRTTVDALALAAALAQPWAGIVLSGAASVAQLQSNIAALDVAWDEEAAHVLRGLAESPTIYWQTRSKLAWN